MENTSNQSNQDYELVEMGPSDDTDAFDNAEDIDRESIDSDPEDAEKCFVLKLCDPCRKVTIVDITVEDDDDKNSNDSDDENSGKCFVSRMYEMYKHILDVIQSFGNVIWTTVDVFSDIYQFFVYLL